MSARAKRARPATPSAVSNALDVLSSLRENNDTSRAATLQIQKEHDVYDLVSEEEYNNIVAERRRLGQIMNDDVGLGYEDDGEEYWEAASSAPGAISKVAQAKRQKMEAAPVTKQRVDPMLLGAHRDQFAKLKGIRENENDDDSSVLMTNLLATLDSVADDDDDDDEDDKPNGPSLDTLAQFGDAIDLSKVELEYVDPSERRQQRRERPAAVHKPAYNSDSLSSALFGSSGPTVKLEDDFDSNETLASVEVHLPPPQRPQTQPLSSASSLITSASNPSNGSILVRKPAPAPKFTLPPMTVKESTGVDWFKIKQQETANGYVIDGADDVKTAEQTQDAVPPADTDSLRVFWYDIHEETTYQPGTVYLFGKLESGASCCVRVNNLDRNIFVLPRRFALEDPRDPDSVTDREVTMAEVYAEIKTALSECGVSKFKSKSVKRRYCFSRESQLNELDGTPKNTESLLDPQLGIPPEATYLKVVYSYRDRPIPKNLQGRTFSVVLNSRVTARETFLMKRNLMGPCWIVIKEAPSKRKDYVPGQAFTAVPKDQMQSWAKHEFIVESQKSILPMSENTLKPPLLSVLSLSLMTTINAEHRNEIVVVSGMVHKQVSIEGATANENAVDHFSFIRPSNHRPLPLDLKSAFEKLKKKATIITNERELLSRLLAQIYVLDPDVIVGHDLHGFQFETLMHRMSALKLPQWAKFGRLKKQSMSNVYNKGGMGGGKSFELIDSNLIAGRILCDTMVGSKEFLSKESSYALTHLAQSQLAVNRTEVDPSECERYFDSTKQILQLIDLNCNDAFLTLSLMFKLVMLPLSKTLTNMAGNIWNRSLRSARAERVEYLLLHEFHGLKFIAPEKYSGKEVREAKQAAEEAKGLVPTSKNGKKRGKPQYSGGLVLEPKKGFYDKFVLLLDFNSLYPSIIREFNLCFTTVKHWLRYSNEQDDGGNNKIADLPEDDCEPGVLPKVISRLIDRRKAVKNLLKNEKNVELRKQLDVRQLALKLVANSMYGCLGFQSSRFFCQPLAALITSQGRDILQKTVDLTNSLGHMVIYGDTDSIMVNTNQLDLGEVKKIGAQIKKEVNKKYKILEIELDGIYKNMLLLKKKKYACLCVQERPDGQISVIREMKGLDLVRRDWSELSKDVGNYVLSQLLNSSQQRETAIENIHTYLSQVKEQILGNKLPLEKYIIHRGLTKNPDDYPDKNNQPHVLVALKMMNEGKVIRVGDHIPYIICKPRNGDMDKGLAHRAESVSAIQRSNGELEVDGTWYLSNQILPPTARLLDPIEETDAGRIADCLGLDPRKFLALNRPSTEMEDAEENSVPIEDDEDKYKDCERLSIACSQCNTKFEIEGVYQGLNALEKSNVPGSIKCGLTCPNTACESKADVFHVVANELTLRFRRHISKYYQSIFACSDYPECNNRTSMMSMINDTCWVCRTGKMNREVSARDLYTQISYYRSLFDVPKARMRLFALNKKRRDLHSDSLDITDPMTESHLRACSALFNHVEKVLNRNSYHYVSLASLFAFTAPRKLMLT